MEYDVITWGRERSSNELNDTLENGCYTLHKSLFLLRLKCSGWVFLALFLPISFVINRLSWKVENYRDNLCFHTKTFFKTLIPFLKMNWVVGLKKHFGSSNTFIFNFWSFDFVRYINLTSCVFHAKKKLTLNHNASCLKDNIFCFRRIIKGSGRGKYRRLSRTKGRVMTTD